jgi:hypothetical protein
MLVKLTYKDSPFILNTDNIESIQFLKPASTNLIDRGLFGPPLHVDNKKPRRAMIRMKSGDPLEITDPESIATLEKLHEQK